MPRQSLLISSSRTDILAAVAWSRKGQAFFRDKAGPVPTTHRDAGDGNTDGGDRALRRPISNCTYLDVPDACLRRPLFSGRIPRPNASRESGSHVILGLFYSVGLSFFYYDTATTVLYLDSRIKRHWW